MARISTLVLSLITLAGCSVENNINSIDDGITGSEVENNGSDATGNGTTDTAYLPEEDTQTDEPNDETDTDEVTEEDDPVDPNECGFLIDQPLGNPDVVTESLATISVVGETNIEVRQGETVHYQLAVTADSCGGIYLHLVDIDLHSEGGHDWMHTVYEDEIPMNLTNLTDGIEYEPLGTNTMSYATSDEQDEMFYTWYDCEQGSSINGACENMDTIHVSAGTSKIIEFDFTATDYAPVGTTFKLHYLEPIWTDEVTGQRVWDAHGDDYATLTVTIVE